MIEVKNLTKRYGQKLAVDNISFTVTKGEVVGFLGPNGAGKSTTMNILTGYLSSSEGTVLIDGIDILENPIEAKRKIGFLPEQPPLYPDMTVKEYLHFVSELKGFKGNIESHLGDICELVKITDVYKRMIHNLSKGFRQRVGLAQALIGGPEILVLDEPTVGLDPRQIIDIRNLINDLGKQHTLILSSHILSEVQATCERVMVINNGVLVADDTTDSLAKNLTKSNRVAVRLVGNREKIEELLSNIDGVASVTFNGSIEHGAFDWTIDAIQDCDIRYPLFEIARQENLPILSLNGLDLTLEEIFLQLTAKDEPNDENGGEE